MHIITYRTRKTSTRKLSQLKPGQLVTIYDAISARDEQYQIADVVERDGRKRIRLVGFNYYMDANLVKGVRADV
jgi:hypothetical protein